MDRCSAVVAVVATTDRVVAVVALEAIHKDPYFHIKILLFGHTRLQREKNHVHINVTLGGALIIIVFLEYSRFRRTPSSAPHHTTPHAH